ncbi:beta-galactosidase [Lapidilactobacillus bayanensis]|uniref:beta-galactosidase n=1 Tax=Lapidilactobacillus bayanensis TaxID=2485998 RepID=UPI000F7A6216|nr:beta-galactosidase [Lapidilactobacillus bayanensis]
METKQFKQILFGGDYNPEQWPKEVWYHDMQLLTKANINEATINVFSWAQLQPTEEKYDFSTLDAIVKLLVENNFQIVLATSTAAVPAWMAKRYPEVERTDFQGRHHRFGERHNACPNSPVFRMYGRRLASKLAQRYGELANVVCWHVSNEYGGQCYCDNCAKAFRVWLQRRYNSIADVNQAWNTNFWGHTFYDWDEIFPPNELGDAIGSDNSNSTIAGLSIDYRRFMSDSMLQNYTDERDAIREFDPETPITTNLMGTFKDLDYFKWAREMNLVSWDNYPAYNTPFSYTAMCHDLMRGVKNGAPFMLMEQTPSQQNWQPFNSLKRPGQMRAMSYQAMAHGADTIQYFQLRQSRGATEKFHGAVISHADTDNTRVFRETATLGQELSALGTETLGGRTPAKVGIIFDWDNYWALEYASGPNVLLKYVDQIHRYYAAFYRQNIAVDMIPTDLSAEQMAQYDLVVAPVLYMVKPGVAEQLTQYVKNGGHFITTFMSGLVDEHDNVDIGGYPGQLRELMGVWVEEFDALPPEKSYQVKFNDQTTSRCDLICDIIHPEGAEVLATYDKGEFYQDTPVVTKNKFGAGSTIYVGTQLADEGLDHLVNALISEFDWEHYTTPAGIEITRRVNDDQALYYLVNNTNEPATIDWPVAGVDLLSGQAVAAGEMSVAAFDVKIVRKR